MDIKKQYYEVITDSWNLLKDHLGGADFDKMVGQAHELDIKYKGTAVYELAQTFVVGVMEELNRLYGEERK